jgi:hypothetical protein
LSSSKTVGVWSVATKCADIDAGYIIPLNVRAFTMKPVFTRLAAKNLVRHGKVPSRIRQD